MKNKDKLLKGIRVIDFSRILVGAYSSMMLADMGAEIIKVESPNGDETRGWGPPFRSKDSIYFASINRNKKSLVLDLKHNEAKGIARGLINSSDILIENFPAGKMKQFGIDYDSIKGENKKLIYASVNGYGNKGPLAKTPAFDLIIQAYSGIMNITGGKETEPFKVGYPMCDIMTGSHVYSSILAALLHRSQTGEGQYLNTSLLEANIFAMPTIVSAYLNSGINAKRRGNDHPNISPYTVFKLKNDEFVSIGVATDFQFEKLWSVLKLNESNNDINSYKTNRLRIEKREGLKEIIQKAIYNFSEEELLENFSKSGIPFSKINSMKDLFDDYDKQNSQTSQIKALDLVRSVETEHYGELKYIRHPVTYSNLDVEEMSSPPILGQDTRSVLKTVLNYSDDKIDKLFNEKVIY